MNYAIPERCRRRCACSPRSHRCLAAPGHPGGCGFIEACKIQASRYDPTEIRRRQLTDLVRRAREPIYVRRIARELPEFGSSTTIWRDVLALVKAGHLRVVHTDLPIDGRVGGIPTAVLVAVE